jgi:hypothetical protein
MKNLDRIKGDKFMNSDKDLYKLTQPDIYSLICELLYVLKDNPKYSIISELAFILDRNSFIKFIKYFGGTTLSIPTEEEFKDVINLLLLYQAIEIDKLPWRKALEEAGIELEKSRSVQRKLALLKKALNNYRLGDRNYD